MASRVLRVGVVGSGPGGLYTTKYLLKAAAGARVDIFDALPTPYGLVRSGVAPDHPEVKSVQNDFDTVMEDERVRFFGNVQVGNHIDVEDLRKRYDAIVLSYGASFDRELGLPSENDFGNIFGARSFVNWYNGHPDYANFLPDLSGDSAIIVGQGNVAIDCARILTKSVDELAQTDIAEHALQALAESKVKNVKVVGRRSHVQAAFTMKELRELTKLSGVGCVVDPAELEMGMTDASLLEIEKTRPKKRMNDLLQKVADKYDKEKRKEKMIELRFLLSPVEIFGEDGKVSKVAFERNALAGDAFQQRPNATGEVVDFDCSLLLRSIGYKSVPLPGVPFDNNKYIANNVGGRVIESDSNPGGLAKMYTSGWLKRGPTGIIGTNINDAKETVSAIIEDLDAGCFSSEASDNADEFDREILDIIQSKGTTVVDWNAYRSIEAEENSRGEHSTPQRPRKKMVTIDEMLQYV
mmetsp:Transcript_3003/g.3566  ORF Transcript_3003/g.3566 Transcript_3003/m.3566 type:complete len:467 (-) Transcript_3003:1040-2440(-)